MTPLDRPNRRLRRYVADLLRGRRPHGFTADEEDADQLRAAIALRSARPGSAAPSEEFLAGLHRRLAAEFREEPAAPPILARGTSRRRVVGAASATVAAAAVGVAVGATVDHALVATPPDEPVVVPNAGRWRTVAASTDLPDGAVLPFDTGALLGFVLRTGGQVRALSGVCSHQGCHLRLDSRAQELACPCHNAAFGLTGAVVRHQLRTTPPDLPAIEVREMDGAVQVYSP
jgi:cytochrome b6-f complex iron-sulfur subunit